MNAKNKSQFGLLFTIASGVVINPLNSSMISVALPLIQHNFNLSYSTVTWLISSFYLSSAIAQPVMGRIGDQLGRKKMFLVGLFLVALSAILAPWAPTFIALLILRLLQSVGSSAIYPSGISIIKEKVSKSQASAMAVIAVCTSSTSALGPTIGGFLVTWGGWPAIFTANFPILILSFYLGCLYLPKEASKIKQPLCETLKKLDIPGIILFALTVLFILWFLLSLENQFQTNLAFGGLLFFIIFVWRELHVDYAFINIRFFYNHLELSTVYIQFIVLNIFFYSMFFGLPTYFQNAMNLDPRYSGLLMLFISGSSVIVSPFTGKWVDRAGFRYPLIVGAVLMTLGAILLTFFFINAIWAVMGGILSVIGISYGVMNVTLQGAMLKLSPVAAVGVSSGLFQTSRYLGSILSSVVLGAVFGSGVSTNHFQNLGYVLIFISSLGFIICLKLCAKLSIAKTAVATVIKDN